MRGITTFGAFTTARLGIFAAQKALDITGHNISNINTEGYTRQVVDQFSLRTGGNDHIATLATGSGVLVSSISQLRDPYLDIRFRAEYASVGSMESRYNGLAELSKVIDEVAKGDDENGLLLGQLSDLISKLEDLQQDQSTSSESLEAVKDSAKTLTRLFHDYAKQLDTVHENQETSLKQDVKTVNGILTQIQNLNENIQKSELYGDKALELRDQRNLLLDDLSKYIKVDITYEPVSVGAGKTVDKLVVKTAGKPQKTLVDGNYVGQLTLTPGNEDGQPKVPLENPAFDPTQPNSATNPRYMQADGTPTDDPARAQTKEYALTLSELTNSLHETLAGSEEVVFGDMELYGSLQATRELLTKAGEFSTKGAQAADSLASTNRGLPYYRNALDAMARKFAQVMNDANTGYMRNSAGNYVDNTGAEIQFTLDAATTPPTTGPRSYKDSLTDAQQAELEAGGIKLGGTLFSNNGNTDETDGITAANLSISKSWSNGSVKIQNSMVMLENSAGHPQVGSTDNDNILHIILAIQESQSYNATEMVPEADGSAPYAKGGFEDYLTGLQATLGRDVKETSTLLNNYYATATELDVSRESVAGVDLNDEAMSMMQYQKSYSAACRLMTTIDEVLDKLINGTGVVGR